MDFSRITLLSLLSAVLICECFASTISCPENERPSVVGSCQRTCNACRDCGPCHCKDGYIREALNEECITEEECHILHTSWLRDIKYGNKRDNFFNCQ
ncbi:hypothetical protein J6590_061356 [Homalodisca vitripennis]|nr:hypothetical protein J6590_061356 [Homalodisca vitripennis]